jgi:hypothetical protein
MKDMTGELQVLACSHIGKEDIQGLPGDWNTDQFLEWFKTEKI